MNRGKPGKAIGTGLLVILAGIQFIQPARNEHSGPFPQHISSVVAVPEPVSGILKNSCYDCHSNNTVYPWYFRIQPVAWYLDHHIDEGKGELNFDEFGTYTLKRQKHKLKEIAEQVAESEMPLSSYTLIHGNARLSEADRKLIVDWANASRNSL